MSGLAMTPAPLDMDLCAFMLATVLVRLILTPSNQATEWSGASLAAEVNKLRFGDMAFNVDPTALSHALRIFKTALEKRFTALVISKKPRVNGEESVPAFYTYPATSSYHLVKFHGEAMWQEEMKATKDESELALMVRVRDMRDVILASKQHTSPHISADRVMRLLCKACSAPRSQGSTATAATPAPGTTIVKQTFLRTGTSANDWSDRTLTRHAEKALSTLQQAFPNGGDLETMEAISVGLVRLIEKEREKEIKSRNLEQEQEHEPNIDRLVSGDGDGNIPLLGSGVTPSDEESSNANAQYELFAAAWVAEQQLEEFGGGDADAPFEDIEGKSNAQLLQQFPSVCELYDEISDVVTFTKEEKNAALSMFDEVFKLYGRREIPWGEGELELRTAMRTVLLLREKPAYKSLKSKTLLRWHRNKGRQLGKRGPRVVEDFERVVLAEIVLAVYDKDQVCQELALL
jgi:hypothetical protein